MKYEPETVKGFQDFLPPESLKRNQIKKIIEKQFQLYGFLPVETPIVEFDQLMTPDNLPSEEQDDAVSDRFKLRDRGKRNLGLRYEFTFQLGRILKTNPNIKLPFKRYQLGEVFRDEPVSSTRFRQFTQCDVDIIGDATVNADAECLALFVDILKELKIKNKVQINNRKLLTTIIESVEIPQVDQIMRELDKIEKQGVDIVKANLRKYTSANQIVTLFKLLEKDIKFFKQNAFAGIAEIEELIETCKFYGIETEFNPFMIRGLGYYTGNIFEIKSENGSSTIAGGGRYDKSVGKFLAREIPAVGISFGLERLTDLAKIETEPQPKALIISISQEKPSIELAKSLRKNQIACSLTFDRPGKALEFANAYKIKFVILLGEEETGKKKFKLKNMQSGKEKLLTEIQLIKALK